MLNDFEIFLKKYFAPLRIPNTKSSLLLILLLILLQLFLISDISNIRYFIFNICDLTIIYTVFSTSCFTISLSLLKSTGTGTNLSESNLSTLLFKLFRSVGTVFSLSVSYLPTSDFRLPKSVF